MKPAATRHARRGVHLPKTTSGWGICLGFAVVEREQFASGLTYHFSTAVRSPRNDSRNDAFGSR